MEVAITGSAGFLGQALTRFCLDQGHKVRGLIRTDGRAPEYHDLKVIVGDINDRDALHQLCDGADLVFHLVSNFRHPEAKLENHKRTNVEGTKSILEVARQCAVARFVHCSTIGVHGDVEDGPVDETGPYAPGDMYQETKLEAELWCRQQVDTSPMEIVVVRPTSLYGPRDLRMLKMFKGLVNRTFPIIGACEQHFHPCYIDDAVRGFYLAATVPDLNGEVFFIGAESSVPLRQYIDTAITALKAKPPLIRLPYAPMEWLAYLCEKMCEPFPIEPPLHRRRIRFYKNNRSFNINKAKNQLGFVPRVNLLSGMEATIDWYKENGYL